MSNNDGYTSGNLLDYDYFLKRYKLNAIDLSKQVEFENQINNKLILLVNLKKIVEQQCFSWLKNQKKQLVIFHKMQ